MTKLVIVDDHEALREGLAALLGGHGLEIVRVATVADAVARGRELHPHVIVLDLNLPDGHGTQVITALRDGGHLEDTAVIVYTATDVPDVSAPDDLGDTVYLTKSKVTPEQLEDRVLRLVDALTGRQTTHRTRSGAGVGT
jgi:CheY-like chemotaxis protein